MKVGSQSVVFQNGVYIKETGTIVGIKEGKSPLSKDFDKIFADENDFVEVCEWKNCLGYDISINEKTLLWTRLLF